MEINENEERINENIIISSKIKEIDICLNKVCKSICKLIVPFSNSYKIGTGFLIKLFKKDNPFYCLMTNEHVINKEIVELKE